MFLPGELDLGDIGFERIEPLATGRPGYHPCVLLKLYIYGYLKSYCQKLVTRVSGGAFG